MSLVVCDTVEAAGAAAGALEKPPNMSLVVCDTVDDAGAAAGALE